MRKKLLAITLLFVLTLAGCGGSKPNGELEMPTAGPTTTPEEGTEDTGEEKYYVTFEATTTEGDAWNSDKFAGSKLTMINVWGTYCGPCLNEMPALGELAAEYAAEEFQIVGIICDVMDTDGQEAIDAAKELISETKANYPHLLLNESLYTNLVGAVTAVPTTFFVGQDGAMIGYLTGALDKESWKQLIDELLAEVQ